MHDPLGIVTVVQGFVRDAKQDESNAPMERPGVSIVETKPELDQRLKNETIGVLDDPPEVALVRYGEVDSDVNSIRVLGRSSTAGASASGWIPRRVEAARNNVEVSIRYFRRSLKVVRT